MLGLFFHILAFAFYCVWIKTVLFRLSADIAEVRTTQDAAARNSIIAIWFLAALALLWVLQSITAFVF